MTITQMTLDDYDHHYEVITPISPLAKRVINYLFDHYYGKQNVNANMSDIAENFDVKSRAIRKVVEEEIPQNTNVVIVATTRGYYIASNEDELLHANDLLLSRLYGSLERIFASKSSNNRNGIYSKIAEMKLKYPVAPEGQIDIKGNVNSYIKKENTYRAR